MRPSFLLLHKNAGNEDKLNLLRIKTMHQNTPKGRNYNNYSEFPMFFQ